MSKNASVAQEFYKVQELWAEIDPVQEWRLAIWSVEYQDLDIVDKFLEIERSPLGKFDDIFFRFEAEYKGVDEDFEKELYEEYISWFEKPRDDMQDIMDALRNDGMLLEEYQPDRSLKPTAQNLWKEMLRLKSCIKDLENSHFCIYIPPTRTDGYPLTDWFRFVLDDGVPLGIRLVTIDYAKQRKVKLRSSPKVEVLHPKLNMAEAIKNEMSKGCNTYDEVSVSERFSKQINIVMECTVGKSTSTLKKEVKKLLSLAKETGDVSSWISGLMIASQAFYSVKDYDRSEEYSNEAIAESEKAMENEEPAGYAIWKGAMLLKTAVLTGKGERRDAIKLYEEMATVASKRGDIYYAMEGYRLAGYLYYELRETNTALEYTLLALAAGSYMDIEMRRQSTFLVAASLAYHLCERSRGQDDIEILEEQLEEWIGEDWKTLIQSDEMEKSKVRKKASIFS
jgi:hypothetical protein